MSEDERDLLVARLESGAERRGLRRIERVPRAREASDLVTAWADLIQTLVPADAAFATFTYSDAKASRYGVGSMESAQRDFRRFLRACDWRGRYFCSVESHKAREVPHLHAVMNGSACRDGLWREWFATRGRCSIQPVIDSERVRLYVAKYVLKDDDGTSTFWR